MGAVAGDETGCGVACIVLVVDLDHGVVDTCVVIGRVQEDGHV